MAHRQNLTGPTVERDHRGLVQDDALTSCVHQRVGGAEINREVAARVRSPQLLCRRDARYRSAEGGVATLVRSEDPELLLEARFDRTTATRPQPQQHGTERCGEERQDEEDDGVAHDSPSGAMSVMCWDSRPHDSPADQRSRFQIGTVALRVSIPNRAASKAAGRWGRTQRR